MMQAPMFLDDDAVRRHLSLETLLPAIEQALIDLSAGRVTQPLRTVMELPGPGSLLFVKPALTANALATKLITQVPGNAARGLPTMIATLLLLDPATGVPLAVMDATWLTELRTAAVSAVATRALRDKRPKRLAILGSGALAVIGQDDNGGANHGIIIIGDERKDQPHVRNLSKSAVLAVVYQCDTVPPVASMLGLNTVSPRKFAVNSSDAQFLAFLQRDPLQSRRIPLRWIAALRQWLRHLQPRDLGVGPALVIQGDADGTVDWRYNLDFVQQLLPGSEVRYLRGAGHQLANEAEACRREYLAELEIWLARHAIALAPASGIEAS